MARHCPSRQMDSNEFPGLLGLLGLVNLDVMSLQKSPSKWPKQMAQDTQVAQAAVGFVLAFTSTAWVRCVPWASWASLDVFHYTLCKLIKLINFCL